MEFRRRSRGCPDQYRIAIITSCLRPASTRRVHLHAVGRAVLMDDVRTFEKSLVGTANDQQPVARSLISVPIGVAPDAAGPAVTATHAVLGHDRFEMAIVACEICRRNKLALRISFMGGSSLRFTPQTNASGKRRGLGKRTRRLHFLAPMNTRQTALAQVCRLLPVLSGNLQRDVAYAAIGTAT